MSPVNMSGMSEYELQRAKNLEENRKILESIRQEQVFNINIYLCPVIPLK